MRRKTCDYINYYILILSYESFAFELLTFEPFDILGFIFQLYKFSPFNIINVLGISNNVALILLSYIFLL